MPRIHNEPQKAGFSAGSGEAAIIPDPDPKWMWCYAVQGQLTAMVVYPHQTN